MFGFFSVIFSFTPRNLFSYTHSPPTTPPPCACRRSFLGGNENKNRRSKSGHDVSERCDAKWACTPWSEGKVNSLTKTVEEALEWVRELWNKSENSAAHKKKASTVHHPRQCHPLITILLPIFFFVRPRSTDVHSEAAAAAASYVQRKKKQ